MYGICTSWRFQNLRMKTTVKAPRCSAEQICTRMAGPKVVKWLHKDQTMAICSSCQDSRWHKKPSDLGKHKNYKFATVRYH